MLRANYKYKPNASSLSSDYAIFDPHETKGFNLIDKKFAKTLGRHGKDYIGIVSIDPGSVNIGVYVIFFWSSGFMQSYLLERLNFVEADRAGESLGVEKYNEAIRKLDQYHHIFIQTHYILIESQMSFNPDMMRMMQHFITYFSLRVADQGVRPLIVEINSELKTRDLGGPVGKAKGESKAQAKARRKKWCRQKAEDIMVKFDDPFKEMIIKKRAKPGQGKTKLDDMGDVVTQAVAWIFRCSQSEWWEDFVEKYLNLNEMFDIPE